MISKVTESNKELIKARIAEINEALAAAGSSTVITSLESYYANIVEIASLATGFHSAPYKYFLMPLDEPVFEIDADKRTITVPAHFAKNGVGVYGDHMAEILYFRIDKYFDYQDLFNVDEIVINWQFRGANVSRHTVLDTNTSIALAPDDTYDPGHIVFGWVITNDMTPSKGTLTFSVSFLKRTGDTYEYVLNTQTASVVINDSLVLEDPSALDSLSRPIFARLSDSRYTVDNVTPLVDPVYRTGAVEDGEAVEFRGLPRFANFDIDNDGIEADSLVLQAAGYVADDGNIEYTWHGTTASGLDDTDADDDGVSIDEGPSRPTTINDYILTSDTVANESVTYYIIVDGTMVALPYNDGINVISAADAIADVNVDVYELGSSLEVSKAGIYQVTMQSVKEVAQSGDTSVEIKSGNVPSQACVVPVAAVPSVVLSTFGVSEADGQYVIENPEEAANYDAFVMSGAPKVVATVNIDESKIYNSETGEGVYGITSDSSLGAVAFKFVDSDAEAPTLEEIEEMEFKRCENGQVFNIVNPLSVKAAKLAIAPADINEEDSQFNQDAIEIAQVGNNIIIKGNLAELKSFASTNQSQGSAKWVGIDLDTGLDSIVGAVWGGTYVLTADDVAEATSVGLSAGHIIFWVKADAVAEEPITIRIGAEGFEDAIMNISFNTYLANDNDFRSGDYCVYAINRRNHTYSVSEPSEALHISQIAPFITSMDVEAVVDNSLISLISSNRATNTSTINLTAAAPSRVIRVFVNDVLSEGVTLELRAVELNQEALINGEIKYQEDVNADSDIPNSYIIENGEFVIDRDPGYFVIEATTRYHGTKRITITEPFHVTSDN